MNVIEAISASEIDHRHDAVALTVVLVAANGYDVVQRTVEYLRRQSIAANIELLLMSPEPSRLEVPDVVVTHFHSVRVVDVGEERRVGAIRAEGIRQARAPYVAMAEDHCFPNQVYAESLLAQHSAGADVVGPGMDNCNPGTATSWALYMIAYGPWTGHGQVRPVSFLPGHNSSYRRELMLGFGNELDDLMGADVIAHWALHGRGSKIIWEPSARCRHVNVTRLTIAAISIYYSSRIFGALRGRSLGPWKRILYFVTTPLVPPLRLYRSVKQLRTLVPSGVSKLKVFGSLSTTLIASAAGEAMGLVFGAGSSAWRDWGEELDRRQSALPEDQHLLDGETPAGDAERFCRPMRVRDEPIRIGLIGCGDVARSVHLPILRQFRDVRIVALADPISAARLGASSYAPDAQLYDDPAALIHDESVEAVLISAPSRLHADLAILALAAGKHVYVEKPIATSLEDGLRVVEAWRIAEKVGMVGFNYRQRPDYIELRRAIHRGRIGKVVAVRSTFCIAREQRDGWRGRRAAGGGRATGSCLTRIGPCPLFAGPAAC